MKAPLYLGRTLSNSLDTLLSLPASPSNEGYLSTAWRTLNGWSAQQKDEESVNEKLARHLGGLWNYHLVRGDVWRQSRIVRTRAAAFVSAALARVGVYVPRDLIIDGLSAYSITWSLSRYLEEHRGWERLERMDDLRLGDIVFTADAPCCPGIPHHVFIFMGWHERLDGLAYVTDDRGSRVIRAIQGPGPSSEVHHDSAESPAAYALRAPRASQPQRLLRASA